MVVTYPGADFRPLGTQTQPKMNSHDIICLHTMVGYLTSTDSMFHDNGYGGTESHFGIGGKWGGDVAKGYDGKVFQWQDLAFTADANFQGNPRVISIETADNAPQSASNLAAWSSKQLDSIVTLVVWLCRKYSIPPILVADSRPGRRGIAYHRQGVEHSDGIGSHPGYLVSGGERWSTSIGKQCPGQARINQISSVIIPRVQDMLNGDEDEMTPADWTKMQAMITQAVNTLKADGLSDEQITRIWTIAPPVVKQSTGGALKTALDRVDSDNLQLQVLTALGTALNTSGHPLTNRLNDMDEKINNIIQMLNSGIPLE